MGAEATEARVRDGPSAMAGGLLQNPDERETRLQEVPQEPGCYLMRDRDSRILYIGKAKKLRTRLRSYFRGHELLSPRIQLMVRQIHDIDFIVTDSEVEALVLESNLIKEHQPYYNILLKDDTSYPYLCITWSEDYPRIFITRRRRLRSPQDRFYGPYVDVGLLRTTLALVKRAFPLRQRPQPLYRDRTCLNFHIGRCPGVCQQHISSEDYRATIQNVAMVFQGRNEELRARLQEQMIRDAERLDFEKAARIRDQLQGLDQLTAHQKMSLPDDRISRDAIAMAANDQLACVQLFQVRAGKLVGRLGFNLDSQAGAPGYLLQRVLEEHYSYVEPSEIPQEVCVQHLLPQADTLTDWLSRKRQRKVRILTPKRQQKAELVELVERNAGFALQRTQRSSQEQQLALEDLAQLLNLDHPPRRIEGYDISHIQGSDAVASQVVFVQGLAARQHYRRYKLKSSSIAPGHSDDFMAMAEVMRRRFRRWSQAKAAGEPMGRHHRHGSHPLDPVGLSDWPDLVMIDGGKGQLSAVTSTLHQLGLAEDLHVCALAKRQEQVFLPGSPEPLNSEPDQLGILLLRRLRDEAHRFAVTYHRQQRRDRMKRSRLSEAPGLGPKRSRELLSHFRSLDAIQAASAEQIAQVEGIGPGVARQVWEFFHPQGW